MKLHRVYQEGFTPSTGPFALEAEASHHLGRVLRLGAGESFILSDGRGLDFQAEVVFSGDSRRPLEARVLQSLPPQPEPKVKISLAVALAKSERFERLIEKAAELGATSFVPMLTARSLGAERAQRLDRWQRIAREASALAGRSRWMEVVTPLGFNEIVNMPVRGVLFTPGPSFRSLSGGSSTWLLIGPEGGFTDEEVELALGGHTGPGEWRAAGLGPRNLRVETAAVLALSLALYENGEFEVGDR